MIKVLLLITGGAIGTVFRYGVSTWVQRSMLHSFPFGILSVNVIGSFLIGFCWSIAETCNLSAGARVFSLHRAVRRIYHILFVCTRYDVADENRRI